MVAGPSSMTLRSFVALVTEEPEGESPEDEDSAIHERSDVYDSDGEPDEPVDIVSEPSVSFPSLATHDQLYGVPLHFSRRDLTRFVRCVICGDETGLLGYQAPCGDFFDMGCLEDMFRRATIDESLFPPRCCQLSIPTADAEANLSSELMKLYNKKAIEFNTPNRMYCSQPRCSAFIGSGTAEAVELICPECFVSTCGHCKAEGHGQVQCSHTDDMNSMAKDMHDKDGWQRCYECHHMVELSVGCYHIICICKAQFCYLCGTKWKECSCPQFAVPPDLT